jgi:small subunit ribosomal protein S4
VFRLGFAVDRAQARQLVNHGHIQVNNHRADIPSMLLNPGDRITVHEGSRRKTYWKEVIDFVDKRLCPVWIERDSKNLSGRVVRLPERSEIEGNLNEQLIVEYYSR